MGKVDLKKLEEIGRELLLAIHEDPNREGLRRTPKRFAKAFAELTRGYFDTRKYDVKFTEQSNLIVLSHIRFFSLCEHHLLPFFGYVHVAYIPRRKVLGASKIIRIVEKFSRRLQIQERMTGQIADELWNLLEPYGVMVIAEGIHLCMMMRGVRNEGRLKTSSLRGVFLWSANPRNEALSIIYGGGKTASRILG